MRMKARRITTVLVAAFLLFATGVVVYGLRVRQSAQVLFESAREIQSTIDAGQQIATWRHRSGRSFEEKTSPDGRDHSYDIRIQNGLLHHLRIVPPTMAAMTVIMRDGELRSVIVVMFSGRGPSTTSGIWVQEWFDSDTVRGFRVNPKGRPWKATVDFSAAVPKAEREKAFELNAECFVQLGGCRSAEDILPGVWELGVGHQ